jgi:2-oxoglutarate ferredoxin oxidoreductase subunit alpha
VAFAIGASYAGKCAVTITSGPGFSLKQEGDRPGGDGRDPLVVVNVQRGGPSTGQPTKVEQGDALAAIFGSHGDAPKVVMAPCSIEDCFLSVITARKIAETFGMVVVVLSDASLRRRSSRSRGRRSTPNGSPRRSTRPPCRRREALRLGSRHGLVAALPARPPGGMHTLTGLAHDRASKVAYDPAINEEGLRARSLKLAALQKTLKAPPVVGRGSEAATCCSIGWGSTMGAIEEGGGAACAARACASRRCTCASCSRCRRASARSCKRFTHAMTIEATGRTSSSDE